MKKSKKSTRGGSREGAGRKPLSAGGSEVFSGAVPREVAAAVDAARGDQTRSQVLREALALWLKKRG